MNPKTPPSKGVRRFDTQIEEIQEALYSVFEYSVEKNKPSRDVSPPKKNMVEIIGPTTFDIADEVADNDNIADVRPRWKVAITAKGKMAMAVEIYESESKNEKLLRILSIEDRSSIFVGVKEVESEKFT